MNIQVVQVREEGRFPSLIEPFVKRRVDCLSSLNLVLVEVESLGKTQESFELSIVNEGHGLISVIPKSLRDSNEGIL